MRALALSILFLSGAASAVAQTESRGTLVIAGGGVSAETADIWAGFLDAAREDGPILIVPSASGAPVVSGQSAKRALVRHGAEETRIAIAPLAVRDDSATPDVDESEWAKNATDPDVATLLRSAAAIWFTGGDQSRMTGLLLGTPALDAIRDARRDGAVIGGTSAGAAIMSDPMITQGDSLAALLGSEDVVEAVGLASGLGFWSGPIVDQHFGERARLGRLTAALAQQEDPANRIGYGIDEDTALIVASDGLYVVGSGYVTIIDARAASFNRNDDGALNADNIVLHLAGSGDRIDPESHVPTPAPWREPTVDQEYVEAARPSSGGIALPPETLADALGEALLDNVTSREIERISFSQDGRGTRFRFEQFPESRGFWGRNPQTDAPHYTISSVRFSIDPVNVTVSPANGGQP